MSTYPTKIEYRGVEILQTPGEVEVFRKALKEVKNVEGDAVEIGVYAGGTAAIIREELPDKPLYLFDTFEGLPDMLIEIDAPSYRPGVCAADIKYVTELMKDEKNVYITKGVFPKGSDIIKDKKFAFAHIDVDIYQGTKDALSFVLPRMVKGGVILFHDYPILEGVHKAVDELVSNVEVVSWRQALIRI